MESMEDSMLDVKRNQIEQRARMLQENLDRRAYNVLVNDNDGVVSQDTGSDGTFDFADVVSGITKLQGNHYSPDTLVVEPEAVGDLMLDDQFTDAASDAGHDTVRTGEVGQIAGVNVQVTNFTDIVHPSADDASNPQGILFDSDFYGYEVTRTPVSSNEYEDESRQADIIQTFTRKDWVSVYDDAAVFVEG
jgi:hypothetical protein